MLCWMSSGSCLMCVTKSSFRSDWMAQPSRRRRTFSISAIASAANTEAVSVTHTSAHRVVSVVPTTPGEPSPSLLPSPPLQTQRQRASHTPPHTASSAWSLPLQENLLHLCCHRLRCKHRGSERHTHHRTPRRQRGPYHCRRTFSISAAIASAANTEAASVTYTTAHRAISVVPSPHHSSHHRAK